MSTPAPTVVGSPFAGIVRMLLYVLWTMLLIPVQALVVLLRLPVAQRLPRFYHRMCCRLLGIRLEVYGRQSRERPALFVGNHTSYLDIEIYGALIDGSFVAKAEVADWPFFGLLAKLQRSVFVDRKIGKLKKQAEMLRARLEAGDSIILFPEGTSGDGNHIRPFRSSLLAAAEIEVGGHKIPVQPISVTFSRLDGIPLGRHLRPFYAWYGDMELVPHMRQVAGLGRLTVTVVFHDAVTLDQFASRKALTQYCHDTVARGHADALSGRIQPPAGAAGQRRW
ncbi:MAG: 1-acyl-sn-glycerol-3-phosphate acyltransferase, partial [Alphaproteobacteria bacterium]|nr:1-acyl-sn-glycerol-3-phosphate acyltransferase [Alphaproteobacteria bacterium]